MTILKKSFLVSVFLFSFLNFENFVNGASIISRTLNELVQNSSTIVMVEAIKIEEVGATHGAPFLMREATCKVIETLKGSVPAGKEIRIALAGGTDSATGVTEVVYGEADIKCGSRYVIMLEEAKYGKSLFRIVFGEYCTFNVIERNDIILTSDKGFQWVSGNEAQPTTYHVETMTLKRLKALLDSNFSSQQTASADSALASAIAITMPEQGSGWGYGFGFILLVLTASFVFVGINRKKAPAFVIMTVTLVVAAFWLTGTSEAYQTFLNKDNKSYVWDLSAQMDGEIPFRVAANVPSMTREIAVSEFQQWASATNGLLKFSYIGLNEEAMPDEKSIRLEWDAEGVIIPNPLYLAYASFRAAGSGKIISARIIFNAKNYTWNNSKLGLVRPPNSNGVREAPLPPVLLHEIGHTLGLDHCDKNKESVVGGYDNMNPPTMNSIIMPGAGKLHQDDIAGIVSLYGANAVEHTPNPADGATEGSAFQEEGNLTVVLAFPGGKNTKWDFGDGTTAIGARVTHTFTVAGTYTIQVEGAKGKSGHVTVVVEPLGQEENNNTKAKPSKVRVRPTK